MQANETVVDRFISQPDPKTCRQCNGTGKIMRVTEDGGGVGDCWLCGGSGEAPNNGFPGGVRIGLKIEHRDADGNLVEVIERDALATKQFAQLVQLNILDTAETVTDTTGTGDALSVNSAATAPTILAGTGTTAATVTDNAMQTQTESVAATINAYSGSGSSGSFTVIGTVTAGAARAYAEVGLQVTVATKTFLICHDSFSVLNVSNGGTLAVTYTLTFS
jgi:hypothetical protein